MGDPKFPTGDVEDAGEIEGAERQESSLKDSDYYEVKAAEVVEELGVNSPERAAEYIDRYAKDLFARAKELPRDKRFQAYTANSFASSGKGVDIISVNTDASHGGYRGWVAVDIWRQKTGPNEDPGPYTGGIEVNRYYQTKSDHSKVDELNISSMRINSTNTVSPKTMYNKKPTLDLGTIEDKKHVFKQGGNEGRGFGSGGRVNKDLNSTLSDTLVKLLIVEDFLSELEETSQ